MSDEQPQKKAEIEKPCSAKEFFEKIPPGRFAKVDHFSEQSEVGYDYYLTFPELNLYCEHDSCTGSRLFKYKGYRIKVTAEEWDYTFFDYVCKNCGISNKTYAVTYSFNKDNITGQMYKFGEYPEFGPPTPSKVVSILGIERDYYFKGRRSENQGLGIAAYAYYRRVVDNQKDKIFDQIISTVKKVDPNNTALLNELESAKSENQFTKAVNSIKQAMPQALLIDGHNPLVLLHDALSDGLHERTDEECLELATSIRVILTDLVGRMSSVVKDTAELKVALSNVLQHNSASKTKGSASRNSKNTTVSSNQMDS